MNPRIPSSPPVVSPVSDVVRRPRWSVMIPVYNCSQFLPYTLESVLNQALPESEMQIEVVDDFSTDGDVEKIVKRIGKGRIGYYRQPQNVGSLWNFNTCINRSTGHLIHLLHGDDMARNGFYEKFSSLFDRHPGIGAAFCRYAYVDEKGNFIRNQTQEMPSDGILENFTISLGERQRIQYVSMVVRRDVYEQLGSFYGVEYGEDWEMWMRIGAKYKVGYIPDILAEYRRHDQSISGKAFLTGKNMRDLEAVITKIRDYVPNDHRQEVERTSRRFYSHYALRTANMLWAKFKNKSGAEAQIREAWKMSRDVKLLYKIIKLYTRITLNI